MDIVFKIKELPDISRGILASLEKGAAATVVALSGELGAGKTAFSQAFAKELGVSDSVVSPTFVIMKSYETKHEHYKRLVHIDAYRLNSHEELMKLGWAEIVADPETIVLIEWPEQVAGAIPAYAQKVRLTHVSDTERRMQF